MKKYTIAIGQMDSQDQKKENLAVAAEMIAQAAQKGARLIAFPETMNFMGKGYRSQAESIPGATTDFLCQKAKEYKLWVVSGSFPEIQENGKPKNTLVLIDPDGTICCKYSKLHLFDVDLPGSEAYRESAYSTAGDAITVIDTPLGKMGFAICFDLRFGELFRLMAMAGAQIICMPSSFTTATGKDHWEMLLRARAAENGVYLIAPNQIGQKTNMQAYGNSMVVDPWGMVIARSSNQPGVTFAEIDLDYLEQVRAQMPLLQNRRDDIYTLQLHP